MKILAIITLLWTAAMPFSFYALASRKAAPQQIVLSSRNHVLFEDVVNDSSVYKAQEEMLKLHLALPKGEPIYLVLNTPGGSILSGWKFIRFVHSLKREVKTITLFAASMGFQFVQAFGERLIVEEGILMAHHGATQCMGTAIQIDECKRMLELIDIVETRRIAERIGISLKEAHRLIEHDRWFMMPIAKQINLIDRQIDMVCAEELLKKHACPFQIAR